MSDIRKRSALPLWLTANVKFLRLSNFDWRVRLSLTDAPPVGALAMHRPAWPRFIDRHDRCHLARLSKKTWREQYCTDNNCQ
jgi:hypothetical protein